MEDRRVMVMLAEPPDAHRWLAKGLAPPVYLLRVSSRVATQEQHDHEICLAGKGWRFWCHLVDLDEDLDVEARHADG